MGRSLIVISRERWDAKIQQLGLDYAADFEPAILSQTAEKIFFDRNHPAWGAAMAKYSPSVGPPSPPAPPSPRPYEKWPRWAKAVAAHRSAEDGGVGDTVKRLTGTAGQAYITFWKAIRLPCRCPERQAQWNRLYDYSRM